METVFTLLSVPETQRVTEIFTLYSYPERLTGNTGTFSPRQVGLSALPKDTTSFGTPGIEPGTF